MKPDDPVLNRPEFLRRIKVDYYPGLWVGGVRKAFGAVAEVIDTPEGEQIESHPPHYIAALWRPLEHGIPFLPRFPYKVSLITPDVLTATRGLLEELPPSARMWIAGPQIDWALVAEVLMLSEPRLEPYHYRELEEFVRAERNATLTSISVHYGGDDAIFKKFVRTTPGAL